MNSLELNLKPTAAGRLLCCVFVLTRPSCFKGKDNLRLHCGFFWRIRLELGISSLLPVDCFSARCEAINVSFISPPWLTFFLDSCLQMFPNCTVSQLLGKWREEYLKGETVRNKLQNSSSPIAGLCFSLFFHFSFPFGYFSLKGIKGFHRRELVFYRVLDAAGWRKLCLFQLPKHVPSLHAPFL